MSDSLIHPTAIISAEAEIGSGVTIGPYCIIEADVRLGDHCVVAAHAQILPGTGIGSGSKIGQASVIGGDPQSLAFDPKTSSFVEIGRNNIVREHVTIHRATVEGATTRVGDGNFLMTGSHIGHDCVVGDGNVIANAVLLGGHVELGDRTYLGGGAAFHQFVHIGDHCIVQGNGRYSKDIPPYTTVMGHNQLIGINAIGLRRAGLRLAERQEIKNLYEILFVANRNVRIGVDAACQNQPWGERAQKMLEFASTPTKRGLCTHHRTAARSGE